MYGVYQMDELPGRMKILLVFIVFSILVMFVDGLMFDNYNSRPSMAMMHMEMKPVITPDPVPPSQEEYLENYGLTPTVPSDPDTPMVPDIVYDNGVPIKLYRIVASNVVHEIRPGVKVSMIAFNGRIPAPTIRVTEGDHVRVLLFNNATDPHTIHWHGIENITSESDGVPDVGQEWVLPGESFTYEFIADPAGTRMYHCHVEAPHHMTMGMYGALIVDPKGADGTADLASGSVMGAADKDSTFLFSEFDTSHPHVPLPGEMMPMGPDGSLPWLLSSPKFAMPFDPNLNEFLVNGKSFPATPIYDVKEGQVVRWRLINLGLTTHSIHIHGHHFTVTHRDGFALPAPFEVDTLSVEPGERYDVWFKADNPGVWMIHDHAGMSAMANGYDPAGVMWVIRYEGVNTDILDAFLERAAVYERNIRHQDDDHGLQTPTSTVGGGMEMGGMAMGGGAH